MKSAVDDSLPAQGGPSVKLLSTRKSILVTLAVILSLFTLGAFADSRTEDQQEDVLHDLDIFAKVVEKVDKYYVDDVNIDEMVREAIQEMLGRLDPHSQFLEGIDYEDLMMNTRGEFGGLGIYITFRDNYPTVISPIDDTPGERAGLRGGDQIVEIEGMSTEGWRVDKAVGYLRGDAGTKVRFKVRRPGAQEAIEYVLTREVINVKSVPFYGKFGDYGYIKVSNFSKHTGQELEAALNELETQGMSGLVLDFRTNPGGLLQTATEVTELFLEDKKLIVYTKGRLQSSTREYYSTNRKVHNGYPIVVMINEGSASATEIFAGALQDWDAAFVVGQTSFGKGTVQTVFSLSETEAIKLTTAKYYTPSGRSIHQDHNEAEPDSEGVVAETLRGRTRTEIARAEKVDSASAARPVYQTASGRTVYGGGGITPDLGFEPLYYTELQRRLERDGLAFSFAIEKVDDKEISETYETTDAMLNRFYAFLDERGFKYDKADLTEENVDYVRTMIAREAVSHKYGRRAMYRVVLNKDPEFQQVLTIMKKAPTLSDMFAYAEEHRSLKKASAE
jgi:carboxyl-terminal processing protease